MADLIKKNNLTEKTVYADELVIANPNLTVKTMVENYALDMSFGEKDTSFEARFVYPHLKGGEFIYLNGTEYGGVVDSVKAMSDYPEVIYKGRTWHGILDSKIIDRSTYQYPANEMLKYFITMGGLRDIFNFIGTPYGNAQLYWRPEKDEPMSGYKFFRSALKDAGLKLCMKMNNGKVDIWIDKASTIENTLVSSVASFTAERTLFIPNHLIAYGELRGDGRDEGDDDLSTVTIDLYADEYGNVSDTQTFSGAEEIQIYKSFSGFKHEKGNEDVYGELRKQLTEKATEELKKLQKFAKAETSVLGNSEWNVGDIVRVTDFNVGFDITTDITGKLIRVEQGVLTVDYSVGSETAKAEAIAIIEPPRPQKLFTWFPMEGYKAGDLWIDNIDDQVLVAVNDFKYDFDPDDWVAVSNLSDNELPEKAMRVAEGAQSTAKRVEGTTDAIKGDLNKVSTDLGNAKGDIVRLNGLIVQTSGDVKKVTEGIAETKVGIDRIDTRITSTNNALSNTDRKISGVKSDVDSVRSDVSSNKSDIAKADKKINDAVNKTNEVKNNLDNVKREVDKIESNVGDIEYGSIIGDSVARRALEAAKSLEGMPTLIRQDPSGIIVGKSVNDEYPEGAVLTRQASHGAFEICVVKDRKITPISSFTKDNITIGKDIKGAPQSIDIGALEISSKGVEVNSFNGPKKGITASSIKAPNVLAIGAHTDNKSASVHMYGGINSEGFDRETNITFKADWFSFANAYNDPESLTPVSANELNDLFQYRTERDTTSLSNLFMHRYGPLVFCNATDMISFTAPAGSWRYHYKITNPRILPRFPVVVRSAGYIHGKLEAADIKIEKDGSVYFRQWGDSYGEMTFAPNFVYLSKEVGYVAGESEIENMRG